jgi:hypothetical protein
MISTSQYATLLQRIEELENDNRYLAHVGVLRKEISELGPNEILAADSPSVDAFGKWRTSSPESIFGSKLTKDKQPLFWDESLETGAGITSTHSTNTASTVILSTLNTAGKFTRQTFMRHNYQEAKSQDIYMTGILSRSGGGTGVERRIGYFDDDNGLFFEDDDSVIGITRRTSVTGSAVDNTVDQADWNLDKMDGSGPLTNPSGITADFSKEMLFVYNFGWLGNDRMRVGLQINGMTFYVHEFLISNILDKVSMSTPNLPLRFQMITTGSSPASTMECQCGAVISEGGSDDLGVLRYVSTEGTHVDANTQNIIYAVVGIRLKSTHFDVSVLPNTISIDEHQGSKFYEWMLIFNPTVAGAPSFSSVTNSAIEFAKGATANTVTGGEIITGGFASSAQKGGTSVDKAIKSARRLGASIAGTPDEIWLCGRPIGGSTNIDLEGSVGYRELQ